jgi:hypothetical protein
MSFGVRVELPGLFPPAQYVDTQSDLQDPYALSFEMHVVFLLRLA